MILDAAVPPSIVGDGEDLTVVFIIIGIVVLLCIIGLIIYLKKRGK